MDLIAIIKIGSQESHTFQVHSMRREATGRQSKQYNNHPCSASLPTDLLSSFGGLGSTLNIVIKVILICFICLNMLVNMMMLGLKSGPQITAKTGIPAGLLFRRIWYSVWKSGVLGITEYRQGRPLLCITKPSFPNTSIVHYTTPSFAT